jgi:hypothetical protein
MTTRLTTEIVYSTPGAENVEAVLKRIADAGKKVGDDTRAGGQKASDGLKLVNAAADEAKRVTGDLTAQLGPLGRIMESVGVAGGAAAARQGAVVLVLGKAFAEAEKANAVARQTEGLLRATGAAAGKTADDIKRLGDEIERTTLAESEDIQRVANTLLTFRNISGSVFDDTLRRAQDLASLGFGSLESNARLLGKALNDPADGLTALTRIGIKFSAQTEDMVKKMAAANDVGGAQKVMLDELAKRVGGAATDEQAGLTGSYNRLGDAVGNFLEEIGHAGPIQAATSALNSLADAIDNLNSKIFDKREKLKAYREELDSLVENRQGGAVWGGGLAAAAIPGRVSLLKEMIAELEREIEVEEKAAAARREAAEAGRAAAKAEADRTAEMEAARAVISEMISAQVKLNAEEDKANKAAAAKAAREVVREEKEAAREAAQAQREFLRDRQRDIESFTNAASAEFRNMWVSGFAGGLADVLPTLGKKLLQWWIGLQAEMLARPLIAPIAAAMYGGGGGGAAAYAGAAGADPMMMAGGPMNLASFFTGSAALYSGASAFATSSFGQMLGLGAPGASITAPGGVFYAAPATLTGAGELFSQGVAASPWGIVGSFGAQMLGLRGTGNALADMGLGTLGSIGGGAAGSAFLTGALGAAGGPVGAIVGAFLAQGLGSLLAGKPSDRLEETMLRFDPANPLGVRSESDLGPGKDSPENRSAADSIMSAVQSIMASISGSTGAKFGVSTLAASVGGRSGIQITADGASGSMPWRSVETAEAAFSELIDYVLSTITEVSPAVKEALNRVDWAGNAEGAARSIDAIVAFEKAVENLGEEIAPTSAIQEALKQIRAQFSGMAGVLVPLGISMEQITAAEGAAVGRLRDQSNEFYADQVLRRRDPKTWELNQLDKEFATIRADAQAIGASLADIETLYGMRRAEILTKYAEEAADTIESTLVGSVNAIQETASEVQAATRDLIEEAFNPLIEVREREIEAAREAAGVWSAAARGLSGLSLSFSTSAEYSGLTLEQRQSDLMRRLRSAAGALAAGDPGAADLIQTLAPQAAAATKEFYRDNVEGVAQLASIRAIVDQSASFAASQVSVAQSQLNVLIQIRDSLVAGRAAAVSPAAGGGAGGAGAVTEAVANATIARYGAARQRFLDGGGSESDWVNSAEFGGWSMVRDSLIAGTSDTSRLLESLSVARQQAADPIYHNAGVAYEAAVIARLKTLGIDSFAQGGTVRRTGLAYVHEGEQVINQGGMGGLASRLDAVAQAVRASGAAGAAGMSRMIEELRSIAANTAEAAAGAAVARLLARG